MHSTHWFVPFFPFKSVLIIIYYVDYLLQLLNEMEKGANFSFSQLFRTLGVYGKDYWPCSVLGVIELPYSNQVALPETLKTQVDAWNSQSIEFYIVLHEMPRFDECQKFSCSNMNEFNVMYHGWAFPDHGYDEEKLSSEKLEAGCFSPIGVQGVHLNLSDGGMAINAIKKDYTVVIHDMSFSPANLMMQLSETHELVSFFSVAHLPNPSLKKTVIQFHLIAASPAMNSSLLDCVSKSITLGDLVTQITAIDNTKESSSQLKSLLRSIPADHPTI
jgi:hypothetical protein